jgi:hypothetical protein
MRKILVAVTALAAAMLAGSYFAYAQQGSPEHPMNFFITSAGMGVGGNFGGLEGADKYCQLLASRVGAGGKTWRAYLSTQARPGQPAINARDRIGSGPWYNANGDMIAQDLAHLHGDTPELARLGNNINKLTNLTEKGQIVYGLGDFPDPMDSNLEYQSKTRYSNRHEVVTGSKPDGRAYTDTTVDYTCNNYTSDAPGTSGENVRRNGIGPAMQVGMSDRNGGGNGSWNSAHSTGGCSRTDVARTHGQAKFYCFAVP